MDYKQQLQHLKEGAEEVGYSFTLVGVDMWELSNQDNILDGQKFLDEQKKLYPHFFRALGMCYSFSIDIGVKRSTNTTSLLLMRNDAHKKWMKHNYDEAAAF